MGDVHGATAAEEQAWSEFLTSADAWQKVGVPSETEMKSALAELVRANNWFAVKATTDARRGATSGTMHNPIHDLAAVYHMYSTWTPGQKVPDTMDESGLWRTSGAKKP
ncbi:MAG: hypothetical protein KGN32_03280 [Burkholderiales bacterium]|nr:hypothetical protein [Burkholderiales bacterium]